MSKSVTVAKELFRLRDMETRTIEVLELQYRNGEINSRLLRDAKKRVRAEHQPKITLLCKQLVALEDRYIKKPSNIAKLKD